MANAPDFAQMGMDASLSELCRLFRVTNTRFYGGELPEVQITVRADQRLQLRGAGLSGLTASETVLLNKRSSGSYLLVLSWVKSSAALEAAEPVRYSENSPNCMKVSRDGAGLGRPETIERAEMHPLENEVSEGPSMRAESLLRIRHTNSTRSKFPKLRLALAGVRRGGPKRMVEVGRCRDVLNTVESRQGRVPLPNHTEFLTRNESRTERTKTPTPQGACRMQAKAHGDSRSRTTEIKVIVVRPLAPNTEVLDKVYHILAASKTAL